MLFTLDIGVLRVIIINLLINIMFLILSFLKKYLFKKIPLFGNPGENATGYHIKVDF